MGASQVSILYHLLWRASQVVFKSIFTLSSINKTIISNFSKSLSSFIISPDLSFILSIIDFLTIFWIAGVLSNFELIDLTFTTIG